MFQDKRDFTLQQLRTFVCAAKAGSFSRAADQLGISQPAVSDQISMLEDRLGCQLFIRRRGTTPLLTNDGTKLLESAELMLSASKEMRGDNPGSRRQRVRLCIGPRLRDVYLKPVLPRLYREHPEIELVLMPLIRPDEVQSGFDRGRIDIVVYSVGDMIGSWPNVRHIAEVPTVLVAAPGTRARLDAGEVTLDELNYIIHSSEAQPEHWVERQFRHKGIKPARPFLYVEFPDIIQQMVEDGQGVAVLMYEQVAESVADGRLEVIVADLPPLQRVVARAPSATPAARIVEDFVLAALNETPPSARLG
ncbi:LysR family transcriptional regulator [Altererythrobacter fulvus]|uniref:LysR family transcriptional regulator n=1 Tax=Caenibius fulvus TaxID=2126012 RepID=UPI003015ED1A